jgi:hypothetical protein
MIRWCTLLRRDVTEHSFLLVIVAAHAPDSFFLHRDKLALDKVGGGKMIFKNLSFLEGTVQRIGNLEGRIPLQKELRQCHRHRTSGP